jgi:hypothetical protein
MVALAHIRIQFPLCLFSGLTVGSAGLYDAPGSTPKGRGMTPDPVEYGLF